MIDTHVPSPHRFQTSLWARCAGWMRTATGATSSTIGASRTFWGRSTQTAGRSPQKTTQMWAFWNLFISDTVVLFVIMLLHTIVKAICIRSFGPVLHELHSSHCPMPTTSALCILQLCRTVKIQMGDVMSSTMEYQLSINSRASDLLTQFQRQSLRSPDNGKGKMRRCVYFSFTKARISLDVFWNNTKITVQFKFDSFNYVLNLMGFHWTCTI